MNSISEQIRTMTAGLTGDKREFFCPNCNKKGSFGVDCDTGKYNCFNPECSIKGNFKKTNKPEKKEYSTEETAQRTWDNSTPVNGHSYLKEKGITATPGIRQNRDDLFIPIYNKTDDIVTGQKIFPEKKDIGGSLTQKIFLTNTHKPKSILKGCFHTIKGNGDYYLCEGYATGASIHEATGATVFVCFQAGNILPVLKELKTDYPNIIICADNDFKTDFNPGLRSGMSAAIKCDTSIAYPTGISGSDFNDMATEHGLEAVKTAIDEAKTFEGHVTGNKDIVYEKWCLQALGNLKMDAPEKYAQKRTFLKSQKIGLTELDRLVNMNAAREEKRETVDKKPDTGVPELEIKPGHIANEVEFCQSVIRKNGDIYERGGRLFFVGKVKNKPGKKKVRRDKKTLLLQEVSQNWLKLHLNKNINFIKKDDDITININCRNELAESIFMNTGHWDFPFISGLLECPTITTEGRIIKDKGYDAETGLLLIDDLGGIEPYTDIERAKRVIHNVISEYKFESDVDYAVAFSAILTSVVRRILITAPYFAIDATMAGSGKTLLCDAISIISTGKTPATLNIPPFDAKEEEKRYDSVLISGDSVILIDNIEHPVKSERLCSMSTQETLTVRILGKSVTINVLNNSLWLMTGNNLRFIGDMIRRVLKCRIDPGLENPEERTFKKDLKKYAYENRKEIVEAVISILKAYINADNKPATNSMGSYDEWNYLIRGACIWIGLKDPCEAKKNIQNDDPEKIKLFNLLTAWKAYYSSAVTVRQVCDECISFPYDVQSDLRDAIQDISRDGKSINPKVIGNFISKNRGKIEQGMYFNQSGSFRNMFKWYVCSIQQDEPQQDTQPQETLQDTQPQDATDAAPICQVPGCNTHKLWHFGEGYSKPRWMCPGCYPEILSN